MAIARHFLIVLFLGLALQAYGSSHSEAPGTAKKPSSDITDFYMFRSYDDDSKLILAMGILGLQHPFAGPNYYTLSDQHFFEFHLSCNENNTDTDHMFQFYFGSALGGNPGPRQDYDSYDYDCDCTYEAPNTEVNQGVQLAIGTPVPQNVGIPLKVFHTITDSSSPINWQDFYYFNYVTGYTYQGFQNANVHPIGQAGSNSQTFNIPFAYVGTKTFGDSDAYETYAREFIYQTDSIPWKDGRCQNTGIRTFVGPRQEPFSIDLGRTFDLVNYVPLPSGTANCESNWDIRNLNTHYIVLEVPISCIQCSDSNSVIAAWAAVRELMHTADDDHIPGQQTNRFGNPLVNELIIGIHEKSRWNYYHPQTDDTFLTYYRYPTFPAILESLFSPAAKAPIVYSANNGRSDIDEVLNGGIPGVNRPPNVYYCDMMRLNLATPVSTGDDSTDFNPYGVLAGDLAGYPNGRRFFDDVVDITLQVAMGALCRDAFSSFQFCANPSVDAPSRNAAFRDGSPISKSDFDDSFPFLRTPTPGSVPRPHPTRCSSASAVQISSLLALLILIVALFF